MCLKMVKSRLQAHALRDDQAQRKSRRRKQKIIAFARKQLHGDPSGHASTRAQIRIIFVDLVSFGLELSDQGLSRCLQALHVGVPVFLSDTPAERLQILRMSAALSDQYRKSKEVVGSPIDRLTHSDGRFGKFSRFTDGSSFSTKFLSGLRTLANTLLPMTFRFQ